MAEMFGVAAGAVGVASLSIQLAESLRKVKGFYASVKNAPLQVAELIEEIEIMQDILSDLESNSHTAASSSNMKRCIKVAQRATKSFASFSEELQALVKRRRYRGGARFALSRDDIKQMLDQLERTKSSLNLAYSLYQQATAEDRHIVVMQALSSSQTSAVQTTQTSQGTLHQQDSFVLPRSGKRLFRITTPEWLCETIWQLEMRRSVSSFNIFVRTYGIVKWGSPIFEACRKGDIIGMQRLFDSGLASPYDQDENGTSLWVEAIVRTRIDSLHFLSQHYDASESASSFGLYYSLAIASRFQSKPLDYSGSCDLRDDIAWLRDTFFETGHGDTNRWEHPDVPKALQLLACPSRDARTVLFWHAIEKCDTFVRFPQFSEVEAKEMLVQYMPDYHNGKLPLQLLAVAYGYAVGLQLNTDGLYLYFPVAMVKDLAHQADIITKEVRDLAHQIDFLERMIALAIVSSMDIHEADNCHTPLFLFLSTSWQLSAYISSWQLTGRCSKFESQRRSLRNALMFWLKTLQGAGVDLIAYGAEESRVFQQHRALEDPVSPEKFWNDVYSLTDSTYILECTFSYGPTPEDWTVELNIPVERYVCEFWQMPGLYDEWATNAIPGSWVDD